MTKHNHLATAYFHIACSGSIIAKITLIYVFKNSTC